MLTRCRANWRARAGFISPQGTQRAQGHEGLGISLLSLCSVRLRTGSKADSYFPKNQGHFPKNSSTLTLFSRKFRDNFFGETVEIMQIRRAAARRMQTLPESMQMPWMNCLVRLERFYASKPVKACQSKTDQSARGQAHSRTLRAVRQAFENAPAFWSSAMALHPFSLGFMPLAFSLIRGLKIKVDQGGSR